MEAEEREPQRTIEKKMSIWILVVVKDLKYADESREVTECSLATRLQIAQQIMFTVTFAVNLICFIFRTFA